MERKDWTLEENRIAEYSYTYGQGTDRLALEIAKSLELNSNVLANLIGVMITTENKEIRKEFFDFLKPHVETKILEKNWKGISDHYGKIQLKFIQKVFPKANIPELVYTYFKRTAWSAAEFLLCDDGSHPNRKEIFKFYTRNYSSLSQWLNLTGFTKSEIKEITDSKKGLEYGIKGISLNGINLEDLPKVDFRYGGVHLTNCLCDGFPMKTFEYPTTDFLSIKNMNLDNFPTDWSAMTYLRQLCFDENNFVFKSFDFVDTIPHLTYFDIGNNKIAHPFSLLVKYKIPLSGNFTFESTEGFDKLKINGKKLIKLGNAFAKAKISDFDKKQFFTKFAQAEKFEEISDLSISDLFTLLKVNYKLVKNVAISRIADLEKTRSKKFPLKKASVVLILGNLQFKTTKEIFDKLDIETTRKTDASFSHVFIGKNPIPFSEIDKFKGGIITESGLKNLYESENPKFIQTAAKDPNENIVEKIESLLFSKDPSNNLIALEMLNSGGIPSGIFDTLILVLKTSEDSNVVKLSRKLLKENAPSDLIPLLNNQIQFKQILGKFREQDICKKLQKLAEHTSISAAEMLSILLYKKFQKGLRYAIQVNQKLSAKRASVLKLMVKHDAFDYSQGLRFKMWRWKEHDYLKKPIKNEIFKFPNDVLNEFPNIKELNFHNSRFFELPPEFADFNAVTKIDLSYNFLTDLLDCLAEFQSLEHLDLSMNSFVELPEVLGKLPSLKTLILKKNRVDSAFQKPIISPALQSKLKNCKIIL